MTGRSQQDSKSILEDHLAESEEPDIEDLCSQRPEHAAALRVLWAEHQRAEAKLACASVFGPPVARRVMEAERGAARAGDGLGDFRLLHPPGSGGMGQVCEAEQLSLGRRVALKLVRPERVNDRTLDLFAREARAGGRLSHPGIVAVYGHGESEGVAWIALELVAGAWTLRDAIDEIDSGEQLPEDFYKHVAQFVALLADALRAAHEAGVIHRDLKP